MAGTMLTKEFCASELMKQVHLTIRIKGMNLQRLRTAIGVFFLQVGVKIIGCGVTIDDGADV